MADMNAFEKNQEVATIDTSRKMRVGIIGTGWIAEPHVRAYQNQPDVEIVAACDLVPGKAEAFCKKFGLEGAKYDYKDEVEMLADKSLALDCVSVCTYNRTHASCTIHALEAGVHVLLEKPMCVTIEEAYDIIRAEKKSGKIVSVGFQPRFNKNMQNIKKIVDSGVLGKIYYIQTGGGRRRGIPTPFGTTFIEDATAGLGALGDIGCYALDLVLNAVGYPKPLTATGFRGAMFGKDPNFVTYFGHKEYAEKFGVDDWATGYIRLEGDITLDFRIGWAQNIDYPCDTIILGTKGGLRVPATDCWNGILTNPCILYQEIAGVQVETVIPLEENDNLWDLKIRSFLDAAKNGTPSPVPTSQIVYNQAILDGIARSSDLGREIELNVLSYDEI